MFHVGFSVASLTYAIMFCMQIGIRFSDGINKGTNEGFSDLSLPKKKLYILLPSGASS